MWHHQYYQFVFFLKYFWQFLNFLSSISTPIVTILQLLIIFRYILRQWSCAGPHDMRFVFHLAAKKRNLASKTILTQSFEKQTAVTKAMWGRGTSDLVISTIWGQKAEMILKPTSLTEPQWVTPTGTGPKVTTKISILLSWLIKQNLFRRRNWGPKQSHSEKHSVLADKVKLVFDGVHCFIITWGTLTLLHFFIMRNLFQRKTDAAELDRPRDDEWQFGVEHNGEKLWAGLLVHLLGDLLLLLLLLVALLSPLAPALLPHLLLILLYILPKEKEVHSDNCVISTLSKNIYFYIPLKNHFARENIFFVTCLITSPVWQHSFCHAPLLSWQPAPPWRKFVLHSQKRKLFLSDEIPFGFAWLPVNDMIYLFHNVGGIGW